MKKIICFLIATVILFELSFQSFAIIDSTESLTYAPSESVGINQLFGALSADVGGNKTVYSNPEDCGRLYLKTAGKADGVLLYDEPASSICVDGGNVYFIAGEEKSKIVRLDAHGICETVVTENTRIDSLSVASGKFVYLTDGSVYINDTHNSGGSSVFAAPDAYAVIAKNDGRIYIIKENNNAVATQSADSCMLEGTEESDIGLTCALLDTESGTMKETNLFEAVSSDTVYQPQDSVYSLAKSITVNGVTIPTSEYPVGSYFTDNGKGCRDHRTGVCGNASEDMCNCKAFYNGTPLKAVQCYGYARYLYLRMFGDIGHEYHKLTNINLGSISSGNITTASFKELLKKGIPGSHLRVTYLKPDGKTVSNHSLIIMDWNEAGFSACECNLDAKCGVFVKQRPYSEFVPTLISVDFYCAPLWGIIEDRLADAMDMFVAFWRKLFEI